MPRGFRTGTVESVREFWSHESCGERYGGGGQIDYGSVDRVRYELEPQIREFAEFDLPFDGRALEIGLGTGADFARNRARGGDWYGVDLTRRALEHVSARCRSSAGLAEGDAQRLPFPDGVFDLVYSWGVILCCPDTACAVAEIYRVLRPGGRAKVMLYHARSWVAVTAWVRWGWWRGAGLKSAVSHMESPGTKCFTIGEAEELFSRFSSYSVRPSHTSWDERWLGPIGRVGGDAMGWFLLCDAIR